MRAHLRPQGRGTARALAGPGGNATGRRNGGRIAERFDAIWMPAMFAWVKAWVANYLELKDLWKAANPAIKIEREGFPLVIPKGPQFEKLARRWVK